MIGHIQNGKLLVLDLPPWTQIADIQHSKDLPYRYLDLRGFK